MQPLVCYGKGAIDKCIHRRNNNNNNNNNNNKLNVDYSFGSMPSEESQII